MDVGKPFPEGCQKTLSWMFQCTLSFKVLPETTVYHFSALFPECFNLSWMFHPFLNFSVQSFPEYFILSCMFHPFLNISGHPFLKHFLKHSVLNVLFIIISWNILSWMFYSETFPETFCPECFSAPFYSETFSETFCPECFIQNHFLKHSVLNVSLSVSYVTRIKSVLSGMMWHDTHEHTHAREGICTIFP